MDIIERGKGGALQLYRDFGLRGLRIGIACDRANADIRYRLGHVDFAICMIDRARAKEKLLADIESGKITREWHV